MKFNLKKFVEYIRKGLYKEYFCEETGNSEELYSEDYIKIHYLVPRAIVALQISHKERFASFLCNQILFKPYTSKIDEAKCILFEASTSDYDFDIYQEFEEVEQNKTTLQIN